LNIHKTDAVPVAEMIAPTPVRIGVLVQPRLLIENSPVCLSVTTLPLLLTKSAVPLSTVGRLGQPVELGDRLGRVA
jgi:hypothetical protein